MSRTVLVGLDAVATAAVRCATLSNMVARGDFRLTVEMSDDQREAVKRTFSSGLLEIGELIMVMGVGLGFKEDELVATIEALVKAKMAEALASESLSEILDRFVGRAGSVQ